MDRYRIHQLLESAMPGDAQYNVAIAARQWIREAGYESDVFAPNVYPTARRDGVRGVRSGDFEANDLVIYHFGVSGEATTVATAHAVAHGRVVLHYHGVTPPEFYRSENPALHRLLMESKDKLRGLSGLVVAAVADSEFGAQELRDLGYSTIAGIVSPVVLDARYDEPPDPNILGKYGADKTNLLFVGRIAPNKRQEDVIKSFYCYQKVNPDSRLLIVGYSGTTLVYQKWLEKLTKHLGLEDVHFLGHVSQSQLNACYEVADVFVSMSEHEGFCVPLVECMQHGVPIVAYSSSAIPETLGGSGVLLNEKDYPVVAEVIDLLIKDSGFRDQVVRRQRERVSRFHPDLVKESFWQALRSAGVCDSRV